MTFPGLNQILSQATLYLKAGRFEAAQKLIEKNIPNDPQIELSTTSLLGVSYLKQSRISDAIRIFKNALKKKLNTTEPSLCLAALLCDLGCYSQAYEIITFIKARPKLKNATANNTLANRYYQCAIACLESECFEEAIENLSKVTQIFPSWQTARIELARTYIKVRNYEKAKQELTQVLKEDGECIDALIWQGVIFYLENNKSEARIIWDKANKTAPKNILSKILLSHIQSL